MTDTMDLQSVASLDRENIGRSTQRILNRGNWGNPEVSLLDTLDGRVVVKDFAKRNPWVRRVLGVWLIDREARAYERLAGIPCVPRLLRRLDSEAIVIEYRPGILLSRSLAGTLPSVFLEELEASVAEMHARGVVHLDLRHRSNILAGEDGHPVLLDFASALRFDPNRLTGRLAVWLFAWIDRRALLKWRARLGPSSESPSARSASH